MQGEKLTSDSKPNKKHSPHHFGSIASTLEYLKGEKKTKKNKQNTESVQSTDTHQPVPVESHPKESQKTKHHRDKSNSSKNTEEKRKHHKADTQHGSEHKAKHKKHKQKKEKPITAASHTSDTLSEDLKSQTIDTNASGATPELTLTSSDEKTVTAVMDEPPTLEPVSAVSNSESDTNQVSKLAFMLSQRTTDFLPLPQDLLTEPSHAADHDLEDREIQERSAFEPPEPPSIIITPSSTPSMPESPRDLSRFERLKNWSGKKFNQGYEAAENYIPGFRWSMNRVVKPTASGLYTAGAWTASKTNQYLLQPTLNYVAKPLWNKVGSPIWRHTGQPVCNGLNGYIIQPAWSGLKTGASWVGNLFTRKSGKPAEGLSTSPCVNAPSSKPDVAEAAINTTGKGWFRALPALALPSFLKKTPTTPTLSSSHVEKKSFKA